MKYCFVNRHKNLHTKSVVLRIRGTNILFLAPLYFYGVFEIGIGYNYRIIVRPTLCAGLGVYWQIVRFA